MVDHNFIVTIKGEDLFSINPNSAIAFLNHKSSQTPSASTLYSASALDLVTIVCFLHLQMAKYSPMNVQQPNVDIRSSRDLPNQHL